MKTNSSARLLFTRPLYLAIILSTSIQFLNFMVFGVLLQGDGPLLPAFLWTVAIGGIGMGSVLGVLIDVIVIGNLHGRQAIGLTTLLSALTLGLVAKGFSWNLGIAAQGLGLSQWPLLYLVSGLLMAVAGGALLGWLLFTPEGNRWLERHRL